INGDVTLTGTVPSYPQYLEAAAAGRRGARVTRLHNHLEVALPDSHSRDDVQLATAANNRPAQNVTMPGGVGTPGAGRGSTTARSAAERTVAGLVGARNVSDDIDIAYVADPVDIALHVQEALDRSALVPDGSDVTAETKDGIVTLTGHVRTLAEHDAAVNAAWMAIGIIDVRDNLQVTG